MLKSRFLLLAALMIVAIVVGCSGGGETPFTPPKDVKAAVESVGTTACLGFWNVSIDKATGNIDVADLRSSDLILNVLGFLEPPPLSGMTIDFDTLVITDPTIEVDVILTHPIPDATFMGFDCRGVVFGPKVANSDGLTVIPGPEFFTGVPFGYQDGLLGAPAEGAGYTGLAGYKYFCDGLGLDDDLPTFFTNSANLANRGVFSENPMQNTRHYVLDWTTSDQAFFVFNYAVYANYNWPVGEAPIEIDDFEITTANSQEAFCGKLTVVSSNLWFSGSAGGGGFNIDAEIWDWQGNIDSVVFYAPDLGVTETAAVADGAGSTAYSWLFSCADPTCSPTATGFYPLYVKAIDAMTFGDSWFMALLPSSNSLFGDNVYNVFAVDLEVKACPAPTVTAINPNNGLAGGSIPLATVTGTNFIAGSSLGVRLEMTSAPDVVATSVVWVSATSVTCAISIPGTQPPGLYDVVVTNGCGTDGIGVGLFTIKKLFKETFDSNPSDWFYANFMWETWCVTATTPAFTTNAPFGPSASGNVRQPNVGVSPDGGYLSTVVSKPFDIPTGYSEVNLRVYQCAGFGGSWIYFCNCNWKIVESSTPGIAPFNSTTAGLPPGGAYLSPSLAHGSTGWGALMGSCGYGPMSGQPGWNNQSNYGGGAFPGTLTQYLDLIIPSGFYGKSVKVCWQFQPDECGYGYSSGFAMDDMEIKVY